MARRARRRGGSGSPPVRLPRPGLAGVIAGGFILLPLVIALALLAAAHEWISDSAAQSTWLLPLFVLPLLYVAIYRIGRFFLALHAARPGSIEIDTPYAPSGVRADELLVELRKALASVHLSSTGPVPGVSGSRDILSDVHTAATDSTTWWGPLVAVLTPSVWRSAYRVSLVIRTDENTGRNGLSVEVASRASHDVSTATVWGDTWTAVAQRAACHIAAYVLPRTRLSRKAPWTPWRGLELNPELFFHFHEARRLARDDRLDEALEHFDQAIAMDPSNTHIRLEKAMVLDRLGLYIDALATYIDVVAAESWYDRGVWRRYRALIGSDPDDRLGPRRLDRSPNGPAVLQVARYRMVCSLAASRRLADQCRRHQRADLDHAPVRQPQRRAEARRVISRLQHLLVPYGRKMLMSHGVDLNLRSKSVDPDSLRELQHRLQVFDEELLRRVFQFAALEESSALQGDYRWFRWRRWRWRRSLPVSQPAIRVLPIWAALQYRYVAITQLRNGSQPAGLPADPERMAERGAGNPKVRFVSRRESRRVRRLLGNEDRQWPPSPVAVKQLLRRAALTGRRPGWLERYNVACTFALSVLTPDVHDPADWPRLQGRIRSLAAEIGRLEQVIDELGTESKKFVAEQARLDEQATAAERARLDEQATVAEQAATRRQERAREQLERDAEKRNVEAEQLLGGLWQRWQEHAGVQAELRRRAEEVRRHQTMVRLAVDQLTQAVVGAGGQFTAGRSPWLRLGDQDLDDLRVTDDYQAFLDRYLPEASPAPVLPRNVALLTIGGHIVRLAGQFAGLRKRHWDRQVMLGTPVAAADLQEEARWWRQFREYCRDWRDWPTRNRLIKLATAFAPDPADFQPAVLTVETDRRWAACARTVLADVDGRHQRDHAEQVGSSSSDGRVISQVTSWLEKSRALQRSAERVIEERNDVLERLGRYLHRRDQRGWTLDEALARTAGSGRPLPAGAIARRLAGAWGAVEQLTDVLRDCRHAPGEVDLAALARQRFRAREQVRVEIQQLRAGLPGGRGRA